MILGRDLLISLGLNIKLSDHVIEADDGPFKGSTTSIVDMGTYEFKDLNTEKITPEELFMNAYTEETDESSVSLLNYYMYFYILNTKRNI